MSSPLSPLRRIAIGLRVLAAGLALAGCDAVVEVNATSNVPARYSSVLVTVKEVWFNKNAAAVPADTDWVKFQLDDGRTIDLANITGGQLTGIADDMVVPAGTYRQIRIILASRDEALFDSADDADATYNNQVTWFDDDGDEQTSPLEVLNSDKGIGIQMELKVVEAAVALGGSPDSASNRVLLKFDAARDLAQFRYGDQTGFLLNPRLEAFDARDAGFIRGSLNLSQLDMAGLDRPDIQVTAQRLDEDLNRRVVVANASISRAGAFVLYPLPLEQRESTTEYDLVIHGPKIQTIIIRDVPVTEGLPGSATGIALSGIAPEPAESFEAQISATAPVFPPGARIGFYQTLPGEHQPYLIEVAALDPLRGGFAEPVVLSRAGTVRYGTYSTSSSLQAGTPGEGAMRYAVAALSPVYGHGAFAGAALRPASPASETASFSVPAIGVPAAAIPGTISATVTVETPGGYDRGLLFVTREAGVVTVASLDEPLQQSLGSTFVDVTQVPAGTSSATLADGLYQLEAWTWNSADPADTFTRHPATEAVDLRGSSAATGSVLIR